MAIVPDVIASALRPVSDAPDPANELAVIMSAAKSPLASRRTMVFAPLTEDAVVRSLLTVPEEIDDPFRLVSDAPDPLNEDAVIVLPAKFPEASRDTIVLAPLADDAEVRALSSVPEEMFDALILVTFAPDPFRVPIKLAAEILLPVKSPEASRATIVEAPLADEADVLALSKVPLLIFEALMLVILAPENEAVADPVPPAEIGRVALLGT